MRSWHNPPPPPFHTGVEMMDSTPLPPGRLRLPRRPERRVDHGRGKWGSAGPRRLPVRLGSSRDRGGRAKGCRVRLEGSRGAGEGRETATRSARDGESVSRQVAIVREGGVLFDEGSPPEASPLPFVGQRAAGGRASRSCFYLSGMMCSPLRRRSNGPPEVEFRGNGPGEPLSFDH